MENQLTGALIGLARATFGNEYKLSASTSAAIFEGLTFLNQRDTLNKESLSEMLHLVREEKRKLVPGCFACTASCGRTDDYDMKNLQNIDKDSRSLKLLLLFALRSLAAHAHCAVKSGRTDSDVEQYFYKALFAIGMDDWGADELLPIMLEMDDIITKLT